MKVLDLDKFVPEKKIIQLGGKKFNITSIPLAITLQAYAVIPIMGKIEKSESIIESDIDILIDVIYKILKVSDETLKKEWVVRQIDIKRFNDILPFIFSALFDTDKKKEDREEDTPNLYTSEESSVVYAENTDGLRDM